MPTQSFRPTTVRRKARLHLGSGGVIYVMVTAVIISAAIYTQANLLFWAFGLMVGGLGISAILSWQMLRNIDVQRILPSHGVAGDPLIIRYHLTNRSWLPVFSLTLMETWGRRWRSWKKQGPIATDPPMLKGRPIGWVLHVGPNQTIQAESVCWPMCRGALKFERIVLATGFPFGLIYKIVTFEQSAETLIYPHLYRINRRLVYSLSNHDPSGRKQRERGGGTEDFYGLRQYRVGDSLKMIDWKRTARTGEMVSREMTQPSPPRIMILLDLQREPDKNSPPTSTPASDVAAGNGSHRQSKQHDEPAPSLDRATLIERAVSLTASLVCEAHFHGYQVGLTVRGGHCPNFPIHHSLPHRTRMLEALARLTSVDANAPFTNTPAATPSVIIWLGHGEQIIHEPMGGSTTLIGAADMAMYVREFDAGVGALLTRQTRQPSRREELGIS